jgi:hypothetical protein
MKNILISFMAVFLIGCSSTPSVPTPTTSYSPKPGEIYVIPFPNYNPGQSTLNTPWQWPSQTALTPEQEKEIDSLSDADSIAKYMQKKFVWKDSYDTSVFLSPKQLYDQTYGVCSAFARYWKFALERKGYTAKFIAFWGPNSAHAVCVFRDKDGVVRMGSNQFLNLKDLDPQKTGDWDVAFKGAAKEWYGEKWSEIFEFDEGAKVNSKIRNENLPPQEYTPYTPGRNVFNIKD